MIGYVAKDSDNSLYLYIKIPEYNKECEWWCGTTEFINITGQFPEFNNMSYTDKPIKVEIKLERI